MNRNPNRATRHCGKSRRGQAMVESALVLLAFIAIMVATMDFGHLLFSHHTMVERVRAALRWAVVNPYDGTGDKVANMILYQQPTVPQNPQSTFMGLARSNLQITYTAANTSNPNDERITVAIVDYQFRFFSPWIAGSFINNASVIESAAMLYKP
jgi:Flp pilus assembly protein TadG